MSEDRIPELLDEVREMRREGQQTRDMVTRLVARDEERDREVADHETRIRVLEKWQYALPITGVTALGSIVVSLWAKMAGGGS